MAEPALSNPSGTDRPVTASSRFAPFATREGDGLCHLTLAVEGIGCASCIQKIESAMNREPDIREARVNFSTQRLALSWEGAAERAEDFADTVEGLGYKVRPFDAGRIKGDARSEEKSLLLAMAVAGFASGNIMLLSFALWTTTSAEMGLITRELFHWISGIIAIPTVLFSGLPFFRSALAVLRKGHTNMDVPISVGIVITTLMSIFQTLTRQEHAYFDSVVMLMFFLLIGRYLDTRARQHARSAASDLLSMMAGTATVLNEDGTSTSLLIRDLREGMTIRVAMGERVPADSVVLDGKSSLDTSLITGESLPQPIGPGEVASSGMLNLDAPLRLKVARAAENSLLADIVRLMEKAEQGQASYVRLADRAARLYTPVVHLLALLTFIGWISFSAIGWQPALMIAVSVLIITCPCAIGLAVPVVQVLATSLLMKRGILVKTGDAFERLAGIDTLLLDKTGTLTVGRPELAEPAALPPEKLQLAASLASQSHHPLSRAIASAYKGPLLGLTVTEHPGEGLEAMKDSKRVRLGNRHWCSIPASADAAPRLELWLAVEGETPQLFTFTDPLREDTAATIAQLKALGLRLVMLSGDRKAMVANVATQLGLDEAVGEMKPGEKFAYLEKLRSEGRKIGMVGDGLNDAPTLAGADVSLSPATAIDMAQNAADIVFMGDRLEPVAKAVEIARFTQHLVRQNFIIAIAYNVIAVPIAMAGFITPLYAALAMSASSLMVIGNAFRLKRRV